MPYTPTSQATAHVGAERQATLKIKASFWEDMPQKMQPLSPIACRPLGPAALLAALFIGFGTACAQSDPPVQPELPSARVQKAAFQSNTFAVAAANPLATQAGYEILRAGGSAVDAAIAVQMVLGVVEPQSSGIGGGGFLLHFDGKKTQAFDGREAAPSAARPNLFLDANGAPIPFEQAAIGGRAVGIPGLVRMLTMAQQQHGRLGWAKLFAPAIRIATEGFPISERMATLLAADKSLKLDPVALRYFFDSQGKPWPQGHVLTNPELAAVLTRIANEGSNALMLGELPQRMADLVRKHPTNPGTLAPLDMSNYRAFVREPLCFDYPVPAQQREYRICGMPPPSSGQLAIGQILGTLRALGELPALQDGQPTAEWLHAYTEAARLALAMWDSLPDEALLQAAAQGALRTAEQVRVHARRMQKDPRAKAKLRDFLHHWLHVEEGAEIAKDQAAYEKAVLLAGNVEGVGKVEAGALAGAGGKEAEFVLIQSGDTLWGVAERAYGNGARYQEIFEANREVIQNPDLIYPGQKIRIPR